MSLKSGDYLLFAFDRPIGPMSIDDPNLVIVQRAGTEAHKVSYDILMPPLAYSDYMIHSGSSNMLKAKHIYSGSEVIRR